MLAPLEKTARNFIGSRFRSRPVTRYLPSTWRKWRQKHEKGTLGISDIYGRSYNVIYVAFWRTIGRYCELDVTMNESPLKAEKSIRLGGDSVIEYSAMIYYSRTSSGTC